jgi:hypothetical protein
MAGVGKGADHPPHPRGLARGLGLPVLGWPAGALKMARSPARLCRGRSSARLAKRGRNMASKKKKAKKRTKPSSHVAGSKSTKRTPKKAAKKKATQKAKPKKTSRKRAAPLKTVAEKLRNRDRGTDLSHGASDIVTLPGIQNPADRRLKEILRSTKMANLPTGTPVWWIDQEGKVRPGLVVAPAQAAGQTVSVRPDDSAYSQQVSAGDLFENGADARAEANARLGKRSGQATP